MAMFVGTIMECIAHLSTLKEGLYEIHEHKEKRTLSANALYWKCVSEMAKAMFISNACMHNQLLRKYGSHKVVDGEEVYVALPDTKETERQIDEDESNHFQPTNQRIKSKRWYILLKPSHEFDTAEMSRLIEGTADEMRQMGLVPPQDEIIQKSFERYEKSRKGDN